MLRNHKLFMSLLCVLGLGFAQMAWAPGEVSFDNDAAKMLGPDYEDEKAGYDSPVNIAERNNARLAAANAAPAELQARLTQYKNLSFFARNLQDQSSLVSKSEIKSGIPDLSRVNLAKSQAAALTFDQQHPRPEANEWIDLGVKNVTRADIANNAAKAFREKEQQAQADGQPSEYEKYKAKKKAKFTTPYDQAEDFKRQRQVNLLTPEQIKVLPKQEVFADKQQKDMFIDNTKFRKQAKFSDKQLQAHQLPDTHIDDFSSVVPKIQDPTTINTWLNTFYPGDLEKLSAFVSKLDMQQVQDPTVRKTLESIHKNLPDLEKARAEQEQERQATIRENRSEINAMKTKFKELPQGQQKKNMMRQHDNLVRQTIKQQNFKPQSIDFNTLNDRINDLLQAPKSQTK